ncbi:hypothetical protein BSKO_13989 [Bryopsis sp. KO-2023]|nr:hypothetical protein BSKO_13989 [Bryopsis sp. KO-2023]
MKDTAVGGGGGRGKKRRAEYAPEDEFPAPREATIGQQIAHIKNKTVRREKFKELKKEQKKKQRDARKRRKNDYEKAVEAGKEPVKRQIPRTIELVRERDVTTVAPEGDEEVDADEFQDEFSGHFNKLTPPKVLITTNQTHGKKVKQFILEMLRVFPIAIYYERRGYPLKKIVEYAKNENFTDIVVFNQNRKEVNAMLVIHLPEGPTALFRIRNLKLKKDIKYCGEPTTHKPELILNNFDTRLGHRLGRMFASLFHQSPQFRGRQAVTFHNLRDYVFFRHHRYVFEEKEKKDKTGRVFRKLKTRLQELGPRFTLKLISLQKGTFDSKFGEFEWTKKKDMKAKRRYFL